MDKGWERFVNKIEQAINKGKVNIKMIEKGLK